ncbi:MAG: nucleotidyl transferase AbiEii/AbiGii toxin family protein, partial [Raoultibacter sp.]
MAQPKQPNSRVNLDKAIEREFGRGPAALRTRTLFADVVVAQMLPDGVVKGGSSLKIRYGNQATRFTRDLDTARNQELGSFIQELEDSLSSGWNNFTGRLVRKQPATPKDVPTAYVMQPFEVKLDYNGKPWNTVRLEVGHNEIG